MSDQEGFAHFAALPIDHNPDGFVVRVRDLPARTVAYIRVLDPYRKGIVYVAYKRLLGWASSRGIDDGQWLGYLWDEPEVVALEKCRYDVALVVDGIADAALAVALGG